MGVCKRSAPGRPRRKPAPGLSASCPGVRTLASRPGEGGVTQPCVSPGLFLAPKPLLRSGCEYRSPLPVLWLWPSARTLLCAWTGGRPAPCLPPPSAGIWANSPTPKKVPPDPSGFNSCNKHSRHLLLCARPCAADSVDFAAGQAEACLLLDPESAVTLRGHAPGRQAWRAVLAG